MAGVGGGRPYSLQQMETSYFIISHICNFIIPVILKAFQAGSKLEVNNRDAQYITIKIDISRCQSFFEHISISPISMDYKITFTTLVHDSNEIPHTEVCACSKTRCEKVQPPPIFGEINCSRIIDSNKGWSYPSKENSLN